MSTQITFEQFAGLVREMRAAQDEYFRFKMKSQLSNAKSLEYRVDKIAKTIPRPPLGEELKQGAETLNLFK